MTETNSTIRKSLPAELDHLVTFISKPKFMDKRPSVSCCYELHTGYSNIDGYYPTKGEAMSAILSEGLLAALLQDNSLGFINI